MISNLCYFMHNLTEERLKSVWVEGETVEVPLLLLRMADVDVILEPRASKSGCVCRNFRLKRNEFAFARIRKSSRSGVHKMNVIQANTTCANCGLECHNLCMLLFIPMRALRKISALSKLSIESTMPTYKAHYGFLDMYKIKMLTRPITACVTRSQAIPTQRTK